MVVTQEKVRNLLAGWADLCGACMFCLCLSLGPLVSPHSTKTYMLSKLWWMLSVDVRVHSWIVCFLMNTVTCPRCHGLLYICIGWAPAPCYHSWLSKAKLSKNRCTCSDTAFLYYLYFVFVLLFKHLVYYTFLPIVAKHICSVSWLQTGGWGEWSRCVADTQLQMDTLKAHDKGSKQRCLYALDSWADHLSHIWNPVVNSHTV